MVPLVTNCCNCLPRSFPVKKPEKSEMGIKSPENIVFFPPYTKNDFYYSLLSERTK